jgi:flagellar hook-length control protein FliK
VGVNSVRSANQAASTRSNASGSSDSGTSALQVAFGGGRATTSPSQQHAKAPQQTLTPRETTKDAAGSKQAAATDTADKQPKTSGSTQASSTEESQGSFEQALAASVSDSETANPPTGAAARSTKNKSTAATAAQAAASLTSTLSSMLGGLTTPDSSPAADATQSEASSSGPEKLSAASAASSLSMPQLFAELDADVGGSQSDAVAPDAGTNTVSDSADTARADNHDALPAPPGPLNNTVTASSPQLPPALFANGTGVSPTGSSATPHAGAQALADLQQTLVELKAQVPAASQTPDDSTDAAGDSANGAAASFGAQVPTNAAMHPDSVSANTQPIQSHVGSNAWSDEIGTRVMLMAQRNIASASLRLSPEHLGPLDVRISVRDGTASVWFGATQADTRAALEQALPRLRELFASQGLNLTHAGVSGESSRNTSQNPQTVRAVTADAAREVSSAPFESVPRALEGLIDIYA